MPGVIDRTNQHAPEPAVETPPAIQADRKSYKSQIEKAHTINYIKALGLAAVALIMHLGIIHDHKQEVEDARNVDTFMPYTPDMETVAIPPTTTQAEAMIREQNLEINDAAEQFNQNIATIVLNDYENADVSSKEQIGETDYYRINVGYATTTDNEDTYGSFRVSFIAKQISPEYIDPSTATQLFASADILPRDGGEPTNVLTLSQSRDTGGDVSTDGWDIKTLQTYSTGETSEKTTDTGFTSPEQLISMRDYQIAAFNALGTFDAVRSGKRLGFLAPQ